MLIGIQRENAGKYKLTNAATYGLRFSTQSDCANMRLTAVTSEYFYMLFRPGM